MAWDPRDNSKKRFPTDQELREQPEPVTAGRFALLMFAALFVSMGVVAALRGQW